MDKHNTERTSMRVLDIFPNNVVILKNLQPGRWPMVRNGHNRSIKFDSQRDSYFWGLISYRDGEEVEECSDFRVLGS
jgi:hypothetical protein